MCGPTSTVNYFPNGIVRAATKRVWQLLNSPSLPTSVGHLLCSERPHQSRADDQCAAFSQISQRTLCNVELGPNAGPFEAWLRICLEVSNFDLYDVYPSWKTVFDSDANFLSHNDARG